MLAERPFDMSMVRSCLFALPLPFVAKTVPLPQAEDELSEYCPPSTAIGQPIGQPAAAAAASWPKQPQNVVLMCGLHRLRHRLRRRRRHRRLRALKQAATGPTPSAVAEKQGLQEVVESQVGPSQSHAANVD